MTPNPRNEGKKRRLVDVTECKMVGAGQVVQRVAKVAVARRRKHVQREIRKRHEVNPRPQSRPGSGILVEGRGGQGAKEYQQKGKETTPNISAALNLMRRVYCVYIRFAGRANNSLVPPPERKDKAWPRQKFFVLETVRLFDSPSSSG